MCQKDSGVSDFVVSGYLASSYVPHTRDAYMGPFLSSRTCGRTRTYLRMPAQVRETR